MNWQKRIAAVAVPPHCRFWYTSKLLAEGCSAKTLYGVI